MSTTLDHSLVDAKRAQEVAEARAELLRRAEAQDIKPFSRVSDFAGDPELTADFDVDEFLRQVHQDRERTSTRREE